jgi:DNA-binding NarL/FixJ family response regulator
MFVSVAARVINMPIKVSIVEDDDLVRESLGVLINGADGFTCLEAYASAEAALQGIPRNPPDVVLMDIHLHNQSGVDCVRRLKATMPGVQVIMLTMYEDDGLVFDSLRAGASGYLLKRTPHVQILAAIEDVHHGGSPMTSSIARKVVHLARQAKVGASSSAAEIAHLTPRELGILQHLSEGYRYKEIADRLQINVETVRTHLRRIYEKLHVSSRTEAVVKFLRD